ncbi:hypothetical protein L596_000820 [Steinernema carpocapsae]|uniref:Uncharacterized protein n=1 Tax=Steinernema carpocapsae TaxID=34508 RepID=A0A4U8UJV4_STECR|nr:hypothetical protein L596_000820 [Steinernema carpocapsae]
MLNGLIAKSTTKTDEPAPVKEQNDSCTKTLCTFANLPPSSTLTPTQNLPFRFSLSRASVPTYQSALLWVLKLFMFEDEINTVLRVIIVVLVVSCFYRLNIKLGNFNQNSKVNNVRAVCAIIAYKKLFSKRRLNDATLAEAVTLTAVTDHEDSRRILQPTLPARRANHHCMLTSTQCQRPAIKRRRNW